MHTTTFAVTPGIARGTFAMFHPFAISILLKTIFPNLPEIMGIDITLMIIASYAKTTRYRTIV
jgi:hypothetical protein